MSQNPTVQATDPDRIEAVWKEVFQAYGVDERRAQHFVELTFGTPRLTAAAPDVTEIHDIVDDALENVDFESYIDQEYTPAEVRATLLYELDRALAGEYVGPASAPREVILSEQTIGLPPNSPVDERDPSEDPATVESVWRGILTDAGVNERRAQHVVELVFGTPELTAAAPDIEEIPSIVAGALKDVSIEEYLDGTPINEVRHNLLMALADALAGEYSGPASAPRAVALSEETLSSQQATKLVQDELGTGPDPTPARLANPMAYQSSSSTVRERELDRTIDEMGGDPETVGDPEAFLAEAIAFGDGDRRHAVLQAFRSKLDEETVSWRTFRETIAAAVDRSSSAREETDEDEEIGELVEQFGRIVDESHYELGHLRAAIDQLEASKRGDE